jgi:hypothetical protein
MSGAHLRPSRLRFAIVLLVIAACQLGLVLGVLALCDVRTERDRIRIEMSCWESCHWREHSYRGYPVPRVEYYEDCSGSSDPWSAEAERRSAPVLVGRNRLVPACLIALALGIPVILAGELRRGWGRLRGPPAPVRSRGYRSAWVIVCAATGGLTVALIDVATNPGDTIWCGIGNVPFERAPGSWMRVPDPQYSFRVDPPQLKWLREQRGELVRDWAKAEYYSDAAAARAWERRTRWTGWGIAWGLLVACAWFRPWRRGCPVSAPGTPGTGGTSRPAV